MENFHEITLAMARVLYHLNGKIIRIRDESRLK